MYILSSLTLPFDSNAIQLIAGNPIQEGFRAYWSALPCITSDNFFEQLEVLIRGLTSDPSRKYSIILQPEFNTGQRRTLGHSFHVNCQPKMEDIISWLTPLIDNFETQSGDGLGPLSLTLSS